MSLELNNITSGYSTGLINENFDKLERYVNESLLNRDSKDENEPNHMEIDLDMNSNRILNLPVPINDSEPVQKRMLDVEREARIAADEHLQSQLNGTTPLEGSAFSPISWHKQVVQSSVVIPDNQNGWSFGPEVEIASGQTVTIGDNSYWTIANGQVAV